MAVLLMSTTIKSRNHKLLKLRHEEENSWLFSFKIETLCTHKTKWMMDVETGDLKFANSNLTVFFFFFKLTGHIALTAKISFNYKRNKFIPKNGNVKNIKIYTQKIMLIMFSSPCMTLLHSRNTGFDCWLFHFFYLFFLRNSLAF